MDTPQILMLSFLGFSRAELLALVEEAENAQIYVAAHLYTDAGIRRAVECGIRAVEHANYIERPTADRVGSPHGLLKTAR